MSIYKLPPNQARLWDHAQVRDFVRQVKQRIGGDLAWGYLSIPMREALIAEKALHTVVGLERGDIACAAIACLRRDMAHVAGLLDD